MKKYKVLLVGCGAISKKHIDACVKNNDRIELSAVCDVDKNRAEDAVKQYRELNGSGSPAVYSDVKNALKTDGPDICAVATSSSSHAPLALQALNAGCHVILEKPMALATQDADSLIEAAGRAEKKLAVCYVTRYAPHVRKTKQFIDEGKFGKIFHISSNVYWNRNNDYYRQAAWRGTWEKDGGTLMNQCTHALDLQQWFMGSELVKVFGTTRKFLRPIEAEDFGSAIFEYKNGAVGTVVGTVDVFPKNLGSEFGIYGEKGTVVFGGTHMNEVKTWIFENEEEYVQPNTGKQGHAGLYEDFIHSLDNGTNPLIDGREGKRSLEMVLGVYKSMMEGKSIDVPFSFDQLEMKKVKLAGFTI